MKPNPQLLFFVIAAFLSACTNRTLPDRDVPTTQATPQAPIVGVTMKELLDHPKDYDGKTIRVVGLVYREFDGYVITAGPDPRRSRPIHHIRLEFSDPIYVDRLDYHKKYVQIDGTLNAHKFGHMNLSAVTIEHITQFELVGKVP